jgi:phage terminase small subunit
LNTLENTAKQLQTTENMEVQMETRLTVGVGQPASLRPKQERFAQAYAASGNAARAYREAFECDPAMKAATARQRGYQLAHEPAVAARVRALLAQAAEGTTISARVRMVRLQEIVEADPSELVSIVAEPCLQCWSTEAIATAIDRGTMPDTANPQEDCAGCKGHGARRVVVTPTDDLSPSARKLLKSVRRKSDGTIEVHLHDQLAAADMLNKMQSVYVDRSVTVSVNASPTLDKMTRDQQLEFLQSLKPAT